MIIKGQEYECTECNGKISFTHSILTAKGEVLLVGKCNCGQVIHMDVLEIYTLMVGDTGIGN